MTDYLSPAVRQAAANLDRHKSFSKLLQAVSDNMQTATAQTSIKEGRDFAVVPSGVIDGRQTYDWCGINDFSDYEADNHFYIWDAARADAHQSLAELSLPDIKCVAVAGQDFTVYEIPGHGYHWETCGPIYGDEYCSEDGFENEIDALNDAIASLAQLDMENDSEPDFSGLEA